MGDSVMQEARAEGGGRTIRVAAVQPDTDFRDKAGNLQRVSALVAMAANQGAKIVLLPELVGGYSYSHYFWESAENGEEGMTAKLLCELSKLHRIHVGASFVEARGEHFYNTFIMCADGKVVGRVCKRDPAALEALYFKGEAGPRVIDCPQLGLRLGVGICYDNQLSHLPDSIAEEEADILLMPHCAMHVEGLPRRLCTSCLWYSVKVLPRRAASMLGIPVIFSNHAGPWGSPILGNPFLHFKADFMGMSQVVDAGGKVVCSGGDERRAVFVGDVTVQPKGTAKQCWAALSGERKPSRYSAFNGLPFIMKRIFEVDEAIFSTLYTLSWSRRQAALAISKGKPTNDIFVVWGVLLSGVSVVGLGGFLVSRHARGHA